MADLRRNNPQRLNDKVAEIIRLRNIRKARQQAIKDYEADPEGYALYLGIPPLNPIRNYPYYGQQKTEEVQKD